LETASDLLENLGYVVLPTTNGRHALEVYDWFEGKIDLVVTDMTMPEMGAVRLAEALRERNPAVRVIAITGYPLEVEGKDLKSHGILDWMEKPVYLSELAQMVDWALKLDNTPVSASS